jgi:beta-phosphoglucomutase-like phosphatase (HAD superfamily)
MDPDLPLELVIFDCDGVLVDSERIAIRVDIEVLAELGWSLTRTRWSSASWGAATKT